MKPSRWLNVLRRVTTGGPYVNGGLSMVVLTFVVAAGISTVGYADKSISSISLAPLYFLPLALSALAWIIQDFASKKRKGALKE